MKPQALSQMMCAPAGDMDMGGGDSPGKLGRAKQAIAEKAGEAASQVKSAASQAAAQARGQAEQYASQTRETAASRIGGYSSALRESARSFEEQDPNIAWFTNQAAEKLEHIADYVRTRDLAGLRVDCENLARRHPAAFFGGMFVAGLVLGNLLKTSGRSRTGAEGGAMDWEPETHADYMTSQTATAGELPTAPATGS